MSFCSATSEATGKDERTIRRAAARGEALGQDLQEIVGTSLDKGVELDALAKMAPEERRPLIDRAKAGEKVSARISDVEEIITQNGSSCMLDGVAQEFVAKLSTH